MEISPESREVIISFFNLALIKTSIMVIVRFWSVLNFCLVFILSSPAQMSYYYPQGGPMNNLIPTPEQFLGYRIGSHHTRHDKIVEYLKELDRLSDRVAIQIIGETYEHRQQVVAIFTSPDNHRQLESIRQKHLAGQMTGNTAEVPLVIHLGYNVHGNEPSSSEAALLTAYYLTASENSESLNWLNQMVILMDPNINPDGRDRHTHWANMHKADPVVADPLDREHTEVWPGGRFNHYWFDLNRDWFLGTHPESRNRIKFFHHWRPYVQTDHHEMGSNATFYFDPGKYSSNNPVVPDYLYKTIYPKYGEYFAQALNDLGSMYYTKESFDKLYPGYGSSYINFYGGAGFLFEQASSRGHVQETSTITLTFQFTIRNQFVSSLTTIRASLAEKSELLKLRREFYRTAGEQAKRSIIKGYVFGDAADRSRTNAFLDILLMHDIEVYDLSAAMTVNGATYVPQSSFMVPVEQPNYIMVRTVFEKEITYTDSLFYDASTWSLVHAFNLPHAELKTLPIRGPKVNVTSIKKPVPEVQFSGYAYVFEITDYLAHKAIYALQQGGAIVQTAFRPFTVGINQHNRTFGYGSISIPVSLQRISADSLYQLIKKVSQSTGIEILPLSTGYNVMGVDLGSNYLRTLRKPEILLLIGPGVAATEAGEIWHVLDQRLQVPMTKLDIQNFSRVNLHRYNVMVMVSGDYRALDKVMVDKLKAWIQNGGTLITLKTATEWAIRQGLAKEKIIPAIDTLKPGEQPRRLNFDAAGETLGARALGGSIFEIDVDTTNPLGFGFTKRKVSNYRNGQTYLVPSNNAYATAAQYSASPLIGGYLHPSSAEKVKNSAAILISSDGSGRIILFADNPNFRGAWYGTNKLFFNALFFGPLINVPQAP